jgi:hypothetical protein
LPSMMVNGPAFVYTQTGDQFFVAKAILSSLPPNQHPHHRAHISMSVSAFIGRLLGLGCTLLLKHQVGRLVIIPGVMTLVTLDDVPH